MTNPDTIQVKLTLPRSEYERAVKKCLDWQNRRKVTASLPAFLRIVIREALKKGTPDVA